MNEEDVALDALKLKIHQDRGFNTHLYKDKCLRRRLAVRMRARGCDRFDEYAALLDRDAVEYERLIDTLTINVTKFFRNSETWEVIERDVIPRLMLSDRAVVRVWSAGCASGEEPYSVSILMHEWAAANRRMDLLERVRIVGTDIDRGSLEAARLGEYQKMSFEETPARLRDRWFSAGPPFRVADSIRSLVRFENADLLSGPPLREQSLILCRNVIIYFDRAVQERLFRMFFDSLLPGGVLVLGRVETLVGAARGSFRPLNARERVYVKPE